MDDASPHHATGGAQLHFGSRDARALVVVFLRGGADGLSLLPPVGDDSYRRLRDGLDDHARDALPLDGIFGLHPRLAPLLPLYRDGALALVPAAGSEDDTRSHFEAQDLMERAGKGVGGGWLGRFLRVRRGAGGTSPASASALAAVALGPSVPESLRGAPAAVALRRLDDLKLGAPEELRRSLLRLYDADPLLAGPARDALQALHRVDALRGRPHRPSADYGKGRFAEGLATVARLLRADVGLEAACLDLEGWDSHFAQARLVERLAGELAQGLAAFAADLGPLLPRTTIVVMSEFGRRVHANASLGTDHGRGGLMMVLGGGVRGGVHGRFPGLGEEALVGPGDVAVATNYRDVLAPVLARTAPGLPLHAVFPGHRPEPLAI